MTSACHADKDCRCSRRYFNSHPTAELRLHYDIPKYPEKLKIMQTSRNSPRLRAVFNIRQRRFPCSAPRHISLQTLCFTIGENGHYYCSADSGSTRNGTEKPILLPRKAHGCFRIRVALPVVGVAKSRSQ